ncbi:MAG: hypothetical protein FVQ84_12110 [Planctomycetes bacterium]|nr:hypothetical protein [Planctomycetota bacterium]
MSNENPNLAHFRYFSSLLTNFRSTTVENSLQITPFYAKQTQFYAFFICKRLFHQKTNPIQTQFNPIQTQFKPKQTQYKANSKPMPPAISPPATLTIDDCLHPAYNDNGHF